MTSHGIELCDVNFRAASCEGAEPRILAVPDEHGSTDWPGFVAHDGVNYTYGQAAEDVWFVHPRRVAHTFWSRLNHDPSSFVVHPRSPSFSELAYYFLREYSDRLSRSAGPADRMVLAVPGYYLRDDATEEEKVGLLLGMAGELKLPLAGVVDMACAALYDPRSPRFNAARPVVVLDLHLHTAELSLLVSDERIQRRAFQHLPQSGLAELLKHLTSTMGNRFLRHTTFDVLENGRIEQLFYSQTKAFLTSGAPEHRYHLNTAKRAYDMQAKREQLVADAQTFVSTLVQAVQKFTELQGVAPALCTLALTERSALVPHLEAALRAHGFARFLRLPVGAAAGGAAALGLQVESLPTDLADVSVQTSVPVQETRHRVSAHWEVHLQKSRATGMPRLVPTHALLDGIGLSLGTSGRFTIATPGHAADLALPDAFNSAADCAVPLIREAGRWWFSDPTLASQGTIPRVEIEAGDRLAFRCGSAASEVIFAHCHGVMVPNGH